MSMEIASAVSAVADVVNVTLVLVGLLIAWVQWRKAKEVTRSEHLHSIIAAFKQDEIAQTFYRFINNSNYGGGDGKGFYIGGLRFGAAGQNGENDKNKDGNNSSVDIEISIDRMLMLFSEICHERDLGVIREDEFRFFDFQINRTLAHKDVKRYLLDFAEHCGKYRIGYPFLALVREGVNIDPQTYAMAMRAASTKKLYKVKFRFDR